MEFFEEILFDFPHIDFHILLAIPNLKWTYSDFLIIWTPSKMHTWDSAQITCMLYPISEILDNFYQLINCDHRSPPVTLQYWKVRSLFVNGGLEAASTSVTQVQLPGAYALIIRLDDATGPVKNSNVPSLIIISSAVTSIGQEIELTTLYFFILIPYLLSNLL